MRGHLGFHWEGVAGFSVGFRGKVTVTEKRKEYKVKEDKEVEYL